MNQEDNLRVCFIDWLLLSNFVCLGVHQVGQCKIHRLLNQCPLLPTPLWILGLYTHQSQIHLHKKERMLGLQQTCLQLQRDLAVSYLPESFQTEVIFIQTYVMLLCYVSNYSYFWSPKLIWDIFLLQVQIHFHNQIIQSIVRKLLSHLVQCNHLLITLIL